MNGRVFWTAIALSVVLVALGCDQNNAKAEQPAVEANAIAGSATTAPQRAPVTKIVFVGKEHACDCTRTRVDGAWKVLHEALGKPVKMPVERLRIDTEADKVAPYQKKRPVMVLPALFFLDSKGNVVELLQGEVTAKQIAGVIQAKKSAP
jgi:hypothetical protein